MKLDYVGFGLLALGLGSLEIVLDEGQRNDWFGSNFIVDFRRDHRGLPDRGGLVGTAPEGRRSSTSMF